MATRKVLFADEVNKHLMAQQWSEYADDIAPATLVAVGFVLFVFPEPATTALGSGLLLFGAAWWFFEWQRP